MFAFCSKLQNFWNSFFKILSDVLGVELIVCPLIAIFGVPSRGQPLSRRQADRDEWGGAESRGNGARPVE